MRISISTAEYAGETVYVVYRDSERLLVTASWSRAAAFAQMLLVSC